MDVTTRLRVSMSARAPSPIALRAPARTGAAVVAVPNMRSTIPLSPLKNGPMSMDATPVNCGEPLGEHVDQGCDAHPH